MLDGPIKIDLFTEDTSQESVNLLLDEVGRFSKVKSSNVYQDKIEIELFDCTLTVDKAKRRFVLKEGRMELFSENLNNILSHLLYISRTETTGTITENDITKQFNNLTIQARIALVGLSKVYRDRGTVKFKLSDVSGPEEAARSVLDYLTDRGFLLKGGSHEDPDYRLTKSIIDSLIHDGALELNENDPKF